MLRNAAGRCALALVVACPAAAAAQDDRLEFGRVIGQVNDGETGRSIEAATVRLVGLDRAPVATNVEGRFTIAGVPRGIHRIEISHVGYATLEQDVNVPLGEDVLVTARLRQRAIELDSLTVTVRARRSLLEEAGFVHRQERGFGHFFVDEEVESWRLIQTIRNVPGLNVRTTGAFSRITIDRLGRECVPEIYLDNVLQRAAEGDLTAVIAGTDIAAMEVHRGINTPPQFKYGPGRPCGAIVIWRRK
jgi:hypothetical protein